MRSARHGFVAGIFLSTKCCAGSTQGRRLLPVQQRADRGGS